MYNSSKPLDALFQDDDQLVTDRALAELRAGRPIVIEAPDGPAIAAALDAAAPSVLDAFASLGHGAMSLVLSSTRARVLGLKADGPVTIPVAGLGRDAIYRLATGAHGVGVASWLPADAAAAAAIELCKNALLLPAALFARGAGHNLPPSIYRVSLEQLRSLLKRERHELEIVSRAQVPLIETSQANFIVFRGGPSLRDQVAIVVGNPDPKRPVLVRVHSACLTGDLFGSLRCDCGDQLRNALAHFAAEDGGILLYLDQEGRGTGIRNKMRAYALQDDGLDTIDADAALGYAPDERRYEIAAGMLRALGYRHVRLLTNNPEKVEGLQRAGIEVVGRRALMGAITAENRDSLATKFHRAGHLFNGALKSAQAVEGA